MPFGTLIASHRALGQVALKGSAGRSVELLCDGGSRPNPGTAHPLVADATGFLPVPPTNPGTNHQAVYDAVDYALDHTITMGAGEVIIELVSRLVWGQLTGNGGCRLLVARQQLSLEVASQIPMVTWKLVKPPFLVAGKVVSSTRALRRYAASARQANAQGLSASVNAHRLTGNVNAPGASGNARGVSSSVNAPGVSGSARQTGGPII
jgi:hypothetical protein